MQPTTNDLSTMLLFLLLILFIDFFELLRLFGFVSFFVCVLGITVLMICVSVMYFYACFARGGGLGLWEGLGWWVLVLFDFRMNICTVQFYICALKINEQIKKENR